MNSTVRAKIAIIDDEPNAVKVLSAILAEEGYHILSAMTAEQGIELMDSEDLDAVITDIKLPGKNGMQLFEYASERHPDVPVIFLTAYGSVDSAVQAMTRGAFYYFIKPPDYLKLKGILARAL